MSTAIVSNKPNSNKFGCCNKFKNLVKKRNEREIIGRDKSRIRVRNLSTNKKIRHNSFYRMKTTAPKNIYNKKSKSNSFYK